MATTVPVYTPFKRTMASDKELAQILGISRATVWRWASEGIIPKPIKITPGTTRWKLSDIPMANQEGK